MRTLVSAAVLCVAAGCSKATPATTTRATGASSYLYVWAGDSAGTSSDFLGVIDADTASPQYGRVVGSVKTGVAGTHPHHTEAVLSPNGHLLANGYHAGRSWLFDLTEPRAPKILTTFGDLAGFSHPHTYLRLSNGHVLATFQYTADSAAAAPEHAAMAAGMKRPKAVRKTGGLVEMDERGTVIRSASAADAAITDKEIFRTAFLN